MYIITDNHLNEKETCSTTIMKFSPLLFIELSLLVPYTDDGPWNRSETFVKV